MYNLDAEIKFVDLCGHDRHFVTQKNNLNGCQMYSFNNWQDCYAADKRTVKGIMRSIEKKSTAGIAATYHNPTFAPRKPK